MPFRISPDLVKILLPVVIPFAKDLAARTETKVDDRVVAALEAALSNPIVLAFLLSMLEGKAPVLPEAAADSDVETAKVLAENETVVKALFALAA